MVFLNPAVLFGLIAAGIPVLLHFLNLQKLKRIEFSTLVFLKELQKTKIRKLKFKQWLLLALRVLIILLVVAAFARPTLESVNLGGASAAKTTSVFILDDSFSMSVVRGNGSYFNNAKQVIKNLIAGMQQGDEAALILASQVEKGKQSTTSLRNVESDLERSNISIITPRYRTVFEQAARILNESHNFNKEIYILSDYQNKLASSGENEKTGELFDEDTQVYIFDFGETEVRNVAVTNFKLDNQILEVGKSISFTAEINNLSNEGIRDGVASLFLNGVRSAQQSFDLAEDELRDLTFNTTLKEAGLIEARIEIEEDEILHDNERFTAFFVPEKINILLLTDVRSDADFLKLALRSGDENSTINIAEKDITELSPENLNKYDAVFLVGSRNFKNGARLKEYINSGGNVIIFPGSQSGLNDFQRMIAELGIPAPAAKIGENNATGSPAFFEEVEYNHLIFSDLFEEKDETKVESPEIYTYFKINPSGMGRPVIRLADNSLFLSEYLLGGGKALLFNSAPLLSWNNFPVKSLFAPLINKIVLYLAARNEAGKQAVAGDEINISIDNLALPQLKIVKPDQTAEYINTEELENERFLNYNNTDSKGVYKFFSGDELIDFISVNFDPEESTSEYMSDEEIEDFIQKLTGAENYVFVEPETDYAAAIQQARFGTELWKYFLIAALIVAMIEMMVARNSKKEIAGLSK